MDTECPNCKGGAKYVKMTTGQEYIQCHADCGYFEVHSDGSFTACDAADVERGCSAPADGPGTSGNFGDGPAAVDAGPSDQKDEAARPAKSNGGDSTPTLSPPPADDEDGEIDVTLTEDVEY